MPLDPKIEQNVARSDVETSDCAAHRQIAEVGDAADINDHAMPRFSTKCGGVKGRNQGRALAAGSDVAAAKICNYADAREFGQQRRIADLQGVACVRPVANGLAVAAARLYRRGGDACLP